MAGCRPTAEPTVEPAVGSVEFIQNEKKIYAAAASSRETNAKERNGDSLVPPLRFYFASFFFVFVRPFVPFPTLGKIPANK